MKTTKVLVIVLAWMVLSILAFASMVILSLPYQNTHRVAVFDHLIAEFATDRVRSVSVGTTIGNQGGPGQLYTRIGGTRVVRVMELTHADADQLPLTHSVSRMSDGSLFDCYECGETAICFEGEKVDIATFEEYFPIDLAVSPRGPWFRLPLSPRRFREVFGKPVRWIRTPTVRM